MLYYVQLSVEIGCVSHQLTLRRSSIREFGNCAQMDLLDAVTTGVKMFQPSCLVLIDTIHHMWLPCRYKCTLHPFLATPNSKYMHERNLIGH